MAMVGKGIGRQEAHETMRRLSLRAADSGKHLREVMLADEAMRQMFTEAEMRSIMDPSSYIGNAAGIVDKALKELR